MTRLRSIFLVVLYALLLTLAIPLLLFCVIFGLRDPIIAYGKWAMRVTRVILRITLEVVGLDKLDPDEVYVFMPNHLSFMDGPLVATVIPRPVRIILKKAVFIVPVLGIAMRYVGFISVDRKGAQGGRKSIERAAALMRAKRYSFLVFPEGTRSRDGKPQAFRRGGFFLALESGAAIIPVTITGTYELMPRGQWYAKSGPIRVSFHDPILTTGYNVETMGALMDAVKESILRG